MHEQQPKLGPLVKAVFCGEMLADVVFMHPAVTSSSRLMCSERTLAVSCLVSCHCGCWSLATTTFSVPVVSSEFSVPVGNRLG